MRKRPLAVLKEMLSGQPVSVETLKKNLKGVVATNCLTNYFSILRKMGADIKTHKENNKIITHYQLMNVVKMKKYYAAQVQLDKDSRVSPLVVAPPVMHHHDFIRSSYETVNPDFDDVDYSDIGGSL